MAALASSARMLLFPRTSFREKAVSVVCGWDLCSLNSCWCLSLCLWTFRSPSAQLLCVMLVCFGSFSPGCFPVLLDPFNNPGNPWITAFAISTSSDSYSHHRVFCESLLFLSLGYTHRLSCLSLIQHFTFLGNLVENVEVPRCYARPHYLASGRVLLTAIPTQIVLIIDVTLSLLFVY